MEMYDWYTYFSSRQFSLGMCDWCTHFSSRQYSWGCMTSIRISLHCNITGDAALCCWRVLVPVTLYPLLVSQDILKHQFLLPSIHYWSAKAYWNTSSSYPVSITAQPRCTETPVPLTLYPLLVSKGILKHQFLLPFNHYWSAKANWNISSSYPVSITAQPRHTETSVHLTLYPLLLSQGILKHHFLLHCSAKLYWNINFSCPVSITAQPGYAETPVLLALYPLQLSQGILKHQFLLPSIHCSAKVYWNTSSSYPLSITTEPSYTETPVLLMPCPLLVSQGILKRQSPCCNFHWINSVSSNHSNLAHETVKLSGRGFDNLLAHINRNVISFFFCESSNK